VLIFEIGKLRMFGVFPVIQKHGEFAKWLSMLDEHDWRLVLVKECIVFMDNAF